MSDICNAALSDVYQAINASPNLIQDKSGKARVDSSKVLISPHLAIAFVKSASPNFQAESMELDSVLSSIAVSMIGIAYPIFVSRKFAVTPELLVTRYRKQVELILDEYYDDLRPGFSSNRVKYLTAWVKAVSDKFKACDIDRPLIAQLYPNWVVILKLASEVNSNTNLQALLNEMKGQGNFAQNNDEVSIRNTAREMLQLDANSLYEKALRHSLDNTFSHIHVPDTLKEAVNELQRLEARDVGVRAMSAALAASLMDKGVISNKEYARYLERPPENTGRNLLRSGDNILLSSMRRSIHERISEHADKYPIFILDCDKESGTEETRTYSDWERAISDSNQLVGALSNQLKSHAEEAKLVLLARDAEYLFDGLSPDEATWAHISRTNTGHLYSRFLRPVKERACVLDCNGQFDNHEQLLSWSSSELNKMYSTESLFESYTNRISVLLEDFLDRSCGSSVPIFVDIGYWGTFPIYLVWVCQFKLGIEAKMMMVESFCSGPPHTINVSSNVNEWKRSSINQLSLPPVDFSRTVEFTDLPSAVASIRLLPFYSYVRYA